MYKILKNIIEMDDYSVQKLSNQPPEPFEWNTVEGTELNVSDCIGGNGKIEVKGNTYQKQLSGKNLWGGFSYSRTVSGVTHIYNKDGTFTINGTATANSDSLISSAAISEGIYKTFPAGTYTISGGTSEVLLYVVRTNGNTIANTSSTTFTKSFTLTEETDLFIRSRVDKGVTVNNATVYCMVESGLTATDYEPYCGGQASPNPDYPQSIKVVTGDNVVKHVGKNLFDKDSQNLKQKYILNDNGEEISSNISQYSQGYTEVKPNTTYTLQGSLIHQNNNMRIYFYDENKNWISRSFSIGLIHIPYTFTTDSNIHFIRFQTVIDAYDSDTIQLEQGSTATQYEPYKEKDYKLNLGTIELCKIGDYQDILFKNVAGDENYNAELEEGAWYKKKVIDKKFLDGEMYFANSGVTNVFYTPVITNYSRINNKPFCDNFKGFNNVDTARSVTIINSVGFNNTYNYNRLYISFNGTIDELKDFLNEKMPTLYYANDNPTYEKITDTTLISQLEALNKFKWFKGVNHIWTETDNLEPVLKGTYRQAINE